MPASLAVTGGILVSFFLRLVICLNSARNLAWVEVEYFVADTQPDILLRGLKSAICVQVLDDSQNSAIHMI